MDANIKSQISIMTLTRNRASFISKAIESAQKQSFLNWEMIVLDDDSNDNTGAILENYMSKDNRIKYYKNSTALGISKNRNLGLSKANGKYIAVLDSDDEWIDNNKLQKQFDFLENNPDYVLIGSNIKIVNEKGNFIKNTNFETEDANIRKKILKSNQIPHSTVMYKKDFADKIGGYDNKLSCVEDLDIFLRLGKLGKMKNLKEITTAYTKHLEGISYKRKLTMAWNHFKIVFINFGKYPNWFWAVFFAKLRVLKNLL
jgi:glycosyltransferase involved in cell wall biosynthesis